MIINLERFYGYEDIFRTLIRLHKLYPKLIQLKSAGISHDNREIPFVVLGKGETGPLFLAGVHGRECVNPIVVTAFIEHYAMMYYSVGEKLLEQYCFYFMPLVNPDGYEIATRGYYAIHDSKLRAQVKKQNIESRMYKGNARGIDINRNFEAVSFVKTEISGTVNSENETKAVINICRQYPILGMIDFHSRGKTIYYHREAMSDAYNHKQFEIACRLAKISKYALNVAQSENPDSISGGNTVHYFSEQFLKPALTMESVEEEADFPLEVRHQKEVYQELKYIPIEFLKLLVKQVTIHS